MKWIIASNNPHKLEELSRLLEKLGMDAASPKDLGISLGDVAETGSSFAENARIKAEHAYRVSGLPAIADDSGLAVDALDGAPGIYSARYAGEGASDDARIQKLLTAMEAVPEADRGARFVSSICVYFSPESILAVEGECRGVIAFHPEGTSGFGYDPVFLYDGRSFARMSPAEKDAVSHRGKALTLLEDALGAYLEAHPALAGDAR